MAIICICCRDYRGKSDGVISLRSPYNEYYWKSHIAGKKHITAVQFYDDRDKQVKEGKQKKKVATSMLGFFSKKKKKKEGDAEEERADVNGMEEEEESVEGAGNKAGQKKASS